MEKEITEEASRRWPIFGEGAMETFGARKLREAFIDGAKFSQERSYTEEDMIEFTEWIANSKLHGYSKQLYEAMIIYKVKTTKELLRIWFEQFKNK